MRPYGAASGTGGARADDGAMKGIPWQMRQAAHWMLVAPRVSILVYPWCGALRGHVHRRSIALWHLTIRPVPVVLQGLRRAGVSIAGGRMPPGFRRLLAGCEQ